MGFSWGSGIERVNKRIFLTFAWGCECSGWSFRCAVPYWSPVAWWVWNAIWGIKIGYVWSCSVCMRWSRTHRPGTCSYLLKNRNIRSHRDSSVGRGWVGRMPNHKWWSIAWTLSRRWVVDGWWILGLKEKVTHPMPLRLDRWRSHYRVILIFCSSIPWFPL